MSSFSYAKAKEPKVPNYTCPKIDALLAAADEAQICAEKISNEVDEIKEKLEELRTANAQLRESAEYWREKAETFADERDAFASLLEETECELRKMEEDK